jgi:glycolate oxidase iron-sulfur subunit
MSPQHTAPGLKDPTYTALIDTCVHCGFCLPACPSYQLLGQEMDSPRGRIYLIRAVAESRLPMSPSVVAHFDTCLGCMACETACPSGVRYAPLLEDMRAAIEHGYRRRPRDRWFREVLFRVLPYPARLRLLAFPIKLLRAIGGILPAAIGSLVASAPPVTFADVPETTPAVGERRRRVGLVTGCVQRAFFSDVNHATVRTLAAEGCDVHAPRRQGCCGALALHAGRDDAAREFAKALIDVFEGSGVDEIVVNAAGCGSAMKSYGHLLRNDPNWAGRAAGFSSRVRDVTETIAALTPRAPRHPINLRIAYHDACHLGHAQGVRQQPRAILESIPGATLVPIADNDVCCGSAGIFNLIQPEMGRDLGRRKADRLADARPDVVVTSNPGCIVQIEASARAAGYTYPVRHIVQLLDDSIRGVGDAAAGAV